MRPLVLSVKRSKFRIDDPTASIDQPQYRHIRPQILERDNFTCQFCGFRSPKFQEVHHLDDNHNNSSPDNLVTACPLCHACNHIALNGDRQTGRLIWLDPALNIGQAQLNNIIRELWLTTLSDHRELRTSAAAMLQRFFTHTLPITQMFGSDSPLYLGEQMLRMSQEVYDNRASVIKSAGLYFLPNRTGFSRQLDFWAKSKLNSFPTSQWVNYSKDKVTSWLQNEFKLDGTDDNIARYLKPTETGSK